MPYTDYSIGYNAGGIFGQYSRIYYNAVYAGDPDTSKTFKGFQNRASITRKAVNMARDQRDKDIKAITDMLANFETTREKANKKTEELQNEYNALVDTAKRRCLEDLDAVIAAKKGEYGHRNRAPSEEQLRLLLTLSLRDSITAREIADVQSQLGDNVQAVKALRDIARKNNIPFPDPADADEIDRKLSVSRDTFKQIIDGIGKPQKELSYSELSFYDYPEHDKGIVAATIEDLDSNIFTTVQAERAAHKPEPLEPGQQYNAVKMFLRGGESLALIATAFNVDSSAIREANPNYDFNEMSPGESIIVPASRLKMGYGISEEQCVPAYYAPEPSYEEKVEKQIGRISAMLNTDDPGDEE